MQIKSFRPPHTSSSTSCDVGFLSPEAFLFHRWNDFSVYVHVQIKLEGEALLTGVLQRQAGSQSLFTPKLYAVSASVRSCAVTPPPDGVTVLHGADCGSTRNEYVFLSRALTSVCRLLGFFFTSFIPPVFRSLQSSYATREERPAESDQA